MANDFWKALMSVDPWIMFLAIIGMIGLIVYLVDLLKKLKDILGIKTKNELEDAKTQEIRDCYTQQLDELKGDIKQINQSIANVTDSNVMLLGDQLSRRCNYYIKLGYIPLNESAYFGAMYEMYHDRLHGNHGVDSLYSYCKENLEVKDTVSNDTAMEDKNENVS